MRVLERSIGRGTPAGATVQKSCSWRHGATGGKSLRRSRTIELFTTQFYSVYALLSPGTGNTEHQAAQRGPASLTASQLHVQKVAEGLAVEGTGKAPSEKPSSTGNMVC